MALQGGLEEGAPPSVSPASPAVASTSRSISGRAGKKSTIHRFLATTHYATLGLAIGASQGKIKQAFRSLSKQHHPDKPFGDVERFLAVRKAHQALTTPARQTQYDRLLFRRLRSLALRRVDTAIKDLEEYLETIPAVVTFDAPTDRRLIMLTPDALARRLRLATAFGVSHEDAGQILRLLLIPLNQTMASHQWTTFAFYEFGMSLSFESYRQKVARRWVFWNTVPQEVQREFVLRVAAERGRMPEELRTTDFYSPLKFLNGGTLSGLLNYYQHQHAARPRKAVLRLLRDLQLLPAPIAEHPDGTIGAVLDDLRRGHVSWGTVRRDVQRQLVDAAARELGRSPSELRATDFEQPIKVLHNRSLGGLLHHYKSHNERGTIRSLKRLKRALHIPPFKPSAALPFGGLAFRELVRNLIHSYVKWDSVPLDLQRQLVLLLAKELGKTPWELESRDFDAPLAALDHNALGGLKAHYGSMQRLRERLGIEFPWASDDELTTFMRQRSATPIYWNSVPVAAQQRLVQLAARELGLQPMALTTDSFTMPMKVFAGKSLKGLLDYYKKVSDSYVDALRRLKATLQLAPSGLEESASADSREQDIVRALAGYGVTVQGGTLGLSDSAVRSPWVMDEMREVDASIPVILDQAQMPSAHLMYGLDTPMPLLTQHAFSKVYVTLATVEGHQQPVLAKWIDPKKGAQITYECWLAQIAARLGVGPRFYGTISDSHGDLVGYAMQIVSGHDVDGLGIPRKDPGMTQISDRLALAGLLSSTDLMRTAAGRLVMIDAGGLSVQNEDAYRAFVAAAAPDALPPAAGLEDAAAAGRAQREHLDVGA